MADDKRLTPRAEDFSAWYNEVVLRAELADYSPVRGCMVIRPNGYGIWERMQRVLDAMFKATGHQNAYFPLFIPESFLHKEAEHVEGFAPEVAVVTHGGGKKLDEPLVVRPTSETIIYAMYAKWVQSYRDLPVLINQWANVVGWDMRTRLFLRTLEFLWQEGHTAHATHDEAEAEARTILGLYREFAEQYMAMPVVTGLKTDAERFAGALRTYAIEAMMQDNKALQAGTSHNLGQNFAKAFEIRYLDQTGVLQHCWTTSWGLSSRVVGAIIMVHGDDQGLIVPPRLAPVQAVLVPIFKNDEEKAAVVPAAKTVFEDLTAAGIRAKLDAREGVTPGFKFNDWEMRGVPLRVEIGPKDVAKQSVVLARRDRPGREGKSAAAVGGLAEVVTKLLAEIQAALYQRALAFREAHTVETGDYNELKAGVENGFVLSYWCGKAACEERIKEETKATLRCVPLEQSGGGRCVSCGEAAREKGLFAKAY